ncbi:polyhydroxybutyrate depolymerase [Agrobacterium vitis]|nr:polyhydroxybutyrate depolymerase [Allorhizobium ampelinum]MUO30601.1 polyhydroxybutyrate depolymerase [Agrobacterium vitis]MUO43578.1 polyhydroxybutyrate depolymerase [Agrobacterium vitis]MUP11466.1 polyhydroxybutyrate depolymerase [Agrobacterium vitis]
MCQIFSFCIVSVFCYRGSAAEDYMQNIENQCEKPVLRRVGTLSVVAIATLVSLLTLSTGSASAAGCGQPRDVGRYDMTLTSGGHERVFSYFIPSSYSSQDKVPVVFDFHGSDSNANEQLDRSEWERVAEREGFIAVAPQGSMPTKRAGYFAWNVPGVAKGEADEEAYIRDVIKAVEDNFCVDPARFYATGYSGGGRMVSQYLCDGNTDFAAAGLVVGLRAGAPKREGDGFVPDAATCKPAKPMSLIAFAGLDDKINPIAGQGLPYWGYGADAALHRWAELDGCKSPTVKTEGRVETTEYAQCSDGARIASYRLAGAGHTWPGSTASLKIQKVIGKVSFDLNATDMMWDFFSKSKR